MAVRETMDRPDCMAHFPDDDGFRWLEMHDDGSVYGHAAIKERGEALELHLTMRRWGPEVLRLVKGDVVWLKQEAKRLGKQTIMGVRANTDGVFDPGLFRFSKLFGFTDFCVLQTASLTVE